MLGADGEKSAFSVEIVVRPLLLEDGLPIHGFRTLMAELGTGWRYRCRLKADPESPLIEPDTEAAPQDKQVGVIYFFRIP